MNTFLITNKEKISNSTLKKKKIKLNKFYFYSNFTPILKKKITKKFYFLEEMFMEKLKIKKLLKSLYQKSSRKYF